MNFRDCRQTILLDGQNAIPISILKSFMDTVDRRFSVAPMMDWTDRHDRFFLRLISRHALLYTEMVTTGALLHNDPHRFLRHHESEHPLAIQLGGSEPDDLARCARLAEQAGYDEVNLNVGCPSERVQSGAFGACLMREPDLVADCVKAMQDKVHTVPITVKHRIGVETGGERYDSYEELCDFVGKIAAAGCRTFIVHARIAILEGLSPKQNRDVPPLIYDTVYRLKQDFPNLEIIINGGIQTLDECEEHLSRVDGVMLGRAAYHTPYVLADVDRRFFGGASGPNRAEVIEGMIPYIRQELAEGTRFNAISRHLLGLYQGVPGARAFRRYISENSHSADADERVLLEASALVEREKARQAI